MLQESSLNFGGETVYILPTDVSNVLLSYSTTYKIYVNKFLPGLTCYCAQRTFIPYQVAAWMVDIQFKLDLRDF